ncbi:MAG: hypothetical protein IJP00_01385 [Firmicutes bacterium]|nr:hypothetical protein [Bacillota bacterium]
MKSFISGLAMLLLLSVFMVQFTVNQVTHDKLLFAQKDITTALQEVKQEGCLTPAIEADLQTKLIDDLKLSDANGIVITASHEDINNRAYRGTVIEYTITLPVKNLVGAASFFGITNNETTKTYNGFVSSEYVG